MYSNNLLDGQKNEQLNEFVIPTIDHSRTIWKLCQNNKRACWPL